MFHCVVSMLRPTVQPYHVIQVHLEEGPMAYRLDIELRTCCCNGMLLRLRRSSEHTASLGGSESRKETVSYFLFVYEVRQLGLCGARAAQLVERQQRTAAKLDATAAALKAQSMRLRDMTQQLVNLLLDGLVCFTCMLVDVLTRSKKFSLLPDCSAPRTICWPRSSKRSMRHDNAIGISSRVSLGHGYWCG